MTNRTNHFQASTQQDILGYLPDSISAADSRSVPMTSKEREEVLLKGREFARSMKGKWLLIAGELNSNGKPPKDPEEQVQESCLDVLLYPQNASKDTSKREYIINVLLDSDGGSLDSAFRIVQYLSRYAKELNVYVPRRAKSASTLITLGADCTYLSEFGELGPLDAQIPDPRDPAKPISALDCFSSVGHVRKFGFDTITEMLKHLIGQPAGEMPLGDLLNMASKFAIGAIVPMLKGVEALAFGTWGRNLLISETYAEILVRSRGVEPLQASKIARRLVYSYPHHPFPIDYLEAQDIGLRVGLMDKESYLHAWQVVKACHGKSFIGFISEQEAKDEQAAKEAREKKEDAEETENIKSSLQANIRDR